MALGVTDSVRRMLGPAADEVGEMLRDWVRLDRYGREMKLLEKFERMTKEAGFSAPVSGSSGDGSLLARRPTHRRSRLSF